ncbi:DUF2877 domain-containing protein [Streptomyces indicus]|uniref:DUF2877 domain-containing protein n=1 Tax=Streptomyces indicus TaxID=417292 RepID=A0A1G8TBQ9_9ACTN|nr:DUF2877 domain-containing protein [Streptomyces indicus]SDJ39019.1 Protein of unknown function [Streptomyces indicus]
MSPEESIPGARGCAVLPVRSGDAALLRSLRSTVGEGVVHSVFSRVVNLLTPQDRLIALAVRGAGHAPRTLTADVTDWTGYGIEAGRRVRFARGSLTLELPHKRLRLTLDGARLWCPDTPSLAHLAPAELAAAAAHLDRLNRAHGALGGMLGATPGAGPMEAAVATALAKGRTGFTAAVPTGDPARIRTAVLSLLGLGPGLTPAGDDFLTGAALVAALPGSALAAFVPVLKDVLDAHPGRTTDLSLATLREAADGRARAELLDLLRLLAERAAPRQLDVPVRKVLAAGHTSGSDTLSGLTAGLHLEEELRGSL